MLWLLCVSLSKNIQLVEQTNTLKNEKYLLNANASAVSKETVYGYCMQL